MNIKGRKATSFLLIAGLLGASAAPACADPYDKLASKITKIAKRSGYKRVAVLPFHSVNSEDAGTGLAVAERLVSRLASKPDIQVVERTLLDRILKEQGLSYRGLVNPKQAKQVGKLLGVDGIISGTYLNLTRRRIEVHARLIDTETARILGAATVKVERELEESWMSSSAFWNMKPPSLGDGGFKVPIVRLYPNPFGGGGDPFKDSLNSGESCDDWEEAVRVRQAATVELKARYWATKLREPGFSSSKLTRNPGSEVRSMALRQKLYARMKELHARGYTQGLTEREHEKLDASDRMAERLETNCY
ncbi:MAG: FlgO family outer membrane protein [Elusimicrobiota bacterium]